MRKYKPQLNEHISRCLNLSGLPNDQIMDIIGGEGIMTAYALKAFAENIIKECIIIARVAEHEDGIPLPSYAIAEHFGVKHNAI